jgi:predicted nucleic acid-binding protein
VTYVLDASVTACWCYHDEEDPRADVALDLLNSERAIVPTHWWFEVRNLLLIGERRRRITEKHTLAFLGQLEEFPIDFTALPDQAAVLAHARTHRLTFYDAAYLELAHRERIALATLDTALTAAARRERVRLIGPQS